MGAEELRGRQEPGHMGFSGHFEGLGSGKDNREKSPSTLSSSQGGEGGIWPYLLLSLWPLADPQ